MAENGRKIMTWKWNKKKQSAAVLLADGFTVKDISEQTGIPVRTIDRWKTNPDFAAEIDRLTQMFGVASKAERMRIAKQIVRQKLAGPRATARDLLDWLKFCQSETSGVKLDLSPLWDLQKLTDEELDDLEKLVIKATPHTGKG